MQSKFAPLLSRCRYNLTEEQFVAGRPAIFIMDALGIPGDGNSANIAAFYKDGKVLIEAHTFWSLMHLVQVSDGEQPEDKIVFVDPISIEDFTKLEETLNKINENKTITRQIEDKTLQDRVGDLYLEESKANPGFESRWF